MPTLLLPLACLLQSCDSGKVRPWQAGDELVVVTCAGPLTYAKDDQGRESGFEHDLAAGLAREMGVRARFLVVGNYREVRQALAEGRGHVGAAWLTRERADDQDFQATTPFYQSGHVLVQHESARPITNLSQLAGATVHVVARARHAEILAAIPALNPPLVVQEHPEWSDLDLLQAVAEKRVGLALTDAPVLDVAQNYYPQLVSQLDMGREQPISWIFPRQTDPELIAKAEAYLGRVAKDGTLDRLEDRYFGHIQRLQQQDVVQFIDRIQAVLPKFRKHFQAAQAATALDWRLLAALAYQESGWDPLATSYTNVRGMMMLTEDTADRMGVTNRLDSQQSITAGARYLAWLREQLPAAVQEPDRTWMALAAYNLGRGHFNGAQQIAPRLKADPNSWFDIKRVLPLLSRPQYYTRLRAGRARGGEAVIMVENVRMFYDILCRRELPFHPAQDLIAKAEGPGLKAH